MVLGSAPHEVLAALHPSWPPLYLALRSSNTQKTCFPGISLVVQADCGFAIYQPGQALKCSKKLLPSQVQVINLHWAHCPYFQKIAEVLKNIR